jgi:hypothetical protein
VEGAKALEIAQDWTTLNDYLKKCLQQSFDQAALYHDSNRRETLKWKVGEKVYLNTKNIKTKQPTKIRLEECRTIPYISMRRIARLLSQTT